MQCPFCATPNDETRTTCLACGTPLGASKPVAAVSDTSAVPANSAGMIQRAKAPETPSATPAGESLPKPTPIIKPTLTITPPTSTPVLTPAPVRELKLATPAATPPREITMATPPSQTPKLSIPTLPATPPVSPTPLPPSPPLPPKPTPITPTPITSLPTPPPPLPPKPLTLTPSLSTVSNIPPTPSTMVTSAPLPPSKPITISHDTTQVEQKIELKKEATSGGVNLSYTPTSSSTSPTPLSPISAPKPSVTPSTALPEFPKDVTPTPLKPITVLPKVSTTPLPSISLSTDISENSPLLPDEEHSSPLIAISIIVAIVLVLGGGGYWVYQGFIKSTPAPTVTTPPKTPPVVTPPVTPIPPADVTDLVSTSVDGTSVKLTWSAPKNVALEAYVLTVEGNDETISKEKTEYIVSNLITDTEYTLVLKVRDEKGLLSAGSTVTVKPTSGIVTPPPSTGPDTVRLTDLDTLKTALESYRKAQGLYPPAISYLGMLNMLIKGKHVTRLIQDPEYPDHEYEYIVAEDQKSYTLKMYSADQKTLVPYENGITGSNLNPTNQVPGATLDSGIEPSESPSGQLEGGTAPSTNI